MKMEKAYILISCEIGAEDDLASKLREIDEIKSATIAYGEYDIVVEVETVDSSEMDKLMKFTIRRLEKIRSTITLRVID